MDEKQKAIIQALKDEKETMETQILISLSKMNKLLEKLE